MFPDTSLDETNYDAFDPPIPKECLESNIDRTPYKWTVSTVPSARCNAANIMPLRHRPQMRVHNKKEPIDIWIKFFTDNMVTMVLNDTKITLSTIRLHCHGRNIISNKRWYIIQDIQQR